MRDRDIWEIESGKRLQTVKGEVGSDWLQSRGSIVFSSDGKKIVAVKFDGTIVNMWDAFQRPNAVDAGVVELNPLPDAYGSAAQHDDSRLPAFLNEGQRFIFRTVLDRIEVRRFRFKFAAAGVNHFVHEWSRWS